MSAADPNDELTLVDTDGNELKIIDNDGNEVSLQDLFGDLPSGTIIELVGGQQ